MVDDEELSACGDGPLEGLPTGVHREGHFVDLCIALHLQAVLGGILYIPHPQVLVQVCDQLISLHGSLLFTGGNYHTAFFVPLQTVFPTQRAGSPLRPLRFLRFRQPRSAV